MNDILNRLESWAKKLFPLGLVLYVGPIPIAHFISSVFGTIWSTVEVVGMRLAGVAIDVALIARRYRWFLFYVPAAVTMCFVIGIYTGSQPWVAAGGIILGLAMIFVWAFANTITFIIAEILNAGQTAVGKSIGFFAWVAQALGATVTFDAGGFKIVDTDAIKKSLRETWDLMIPILLLCLLLYMVPTWKTFFTIPGLILIVMIGLVLTISTGKDTKKTRLMWLRVVNLVGAGVVVWLIFSQVMPKTAGAVTTRTKTTDQTLSELLSGDGKEMTCNQRIDLLDKTGAVKDSLKAGEQFVMCSSMDTTFSGTNYKLTFHVTPAGPKWAGYAWEALIKKNAEKDWKEVVKPVDPGKGTNQQKLSFGVKPDSAGLLITVQNPSRKFFALNFESGEEFHIKDAEETAIIKVHYPSKYTIVTAEGMTQRIAATTKVENGERIVEVI